MVILASFFFLQWKYIFLYFDMYVFPVIPGNTIRKRQILMHLSFYKIGIFGSLYITFYRVQKHNQILSTVMISMYIFGLLEPEWSNLQTPHSSSLKMLQISPEPVAGSGL